MGSGKRLESYMKKIERISALERKYVLEVLDNGFESSKNYSMVTQLEKEFAKLFGAKYAVAMINGTATLHAALEAAGVGEGDEVICPALTMSSTSIAVLHANAIPVFADIDPDTFTISVDSIKSLITERTKAIIPVSLYGLSSDIDAIMGIAAEHGLTVIEDNAECYLGYYKDRIVGSTAHMSSFSFQASKHLTAGEGGMVVTDDPDLALKLRRYSGLGYGTIGLEKGRITKEEIQSPTFERHVVLGWNYRPSDLCGAVALAQIQRVHELVEMRVLAAEHLIDAIRGFDWIVPQMVPEGYVNSYWTMVAKLDTDHVPWAEFKRKFSELGGDGVYGAWMLGYMEPMFQNHSFLGREKYIEKYGDYAYGQGLCPVAEKVQPRLLQFKTNYWDEVDAVRQAEILHATALYFD